MSTKINYGLGATVNVGNYESVRVDFGVEDEVRDGESKEDAVQRIVQFVDDNWMKRVQAAVQKFRDAG